MAQRVVIHVDLDCFYAQVEQLRLKIPSSTPLGVQQWNFLIAVNYAARAAGVKKQTSITEAKEKCPNIVLQHVATYTSSDSTPTYHSDPTQNTHKASLDFYRAASAEILKVLEEFFKELRELCFGRAENDAVSRIFPEIANWTVTTKTPKSDYSPFIIEKASIDEAYIDISEYVHWVIDNKVPIKGAVKNTDGFELDWTDLGYLADAPKAFNNEAEESASDEVSEQYRIEDFSVFIGAVIGSCMRRTIFDKLGYTCSTGIASNKTLAKLCSPVKKPNGQTILLLRNVESFICKLPFQKIRMLGGKLGKEVEVELGVETTGELRQYSEEFLQQKFGESTGSWLFNICRGVCNEPVVERSASKSMMAAKQLAPPCKSMPQLAEWITILVSELYNRVNMNFQSTKRWPKNMVLLIRTPTSSITKSTTFLSRHSLTIPLFYSKVMNLLSTFTEKLPCSAVSVNLTQFEKAEGEFIKQYFQSVPASSTPAPSTTTEFAELSAQSNDMTETIVEVNDGDSTSNDTKICEKCDPPVKITLGDWGEHVDFHFAKELNEREIASERIEERVKLGIHKELKRGTDGEKKVSSSALKKKRKTDNTGKLTQFFSKS
ncbi:DNA-directed DNA polymerase eta rad30 [Nowakowskiella sp. JEL0407]|nr:DNA-directed DNA polymerase eta rad30 [Nowakowskiella sp. JEL0407]